MPVIQNESFKTPGNETSLLPILQNRKKRKINERDSESKHWRDVFFSLLPAQAGYFSHLPFCIAGMHRNLKYSATTPQKFLEIPTIMKNESANVSMGGREEKRKNRTRRTMQILETSSLPKS